MDSSVVNFKEATEEAKRKRYASLVLKTFEDMEHAENRELLQRKAEAENASRQRL